MSDDFWSQGYDPFENPVVERSYTKGQFKKQDEEYEDANYTVETESSGGGNNTPPPVDNSNLDSEEYSTSFEEEIPEPDFNESEDAGIEDADFSEDDGDGKLGGDNLKDLTPRQKKKSAEQLADGILDVYCQAIPTVYKHFAKFNERKVKKLQRHGEIDLSIKTEEGVTAWEHIQAQNEFVDEGFTVDEETREEIKEPLVEVLMEQGLALTPTQRLLFAVGKHQVTMISITYNINKQNKNFIEDLKEMHQMNMAYAIRKKKATLKKQKVAYSTIADMPVSEQNEAMQIMSQLGIEDDDEIVDFNAEETTED
jgi:hypothetical protein